MAEMLKIKLVKSMIGRPEKHRNVLRGIEARELGSEYGVKTLVTLGPRLIPIDRDDVQP